MLELMQLRGEKRGLGPDAMTLRAKMIQILLLQVVFYVGAWSVASLNTQMRTAYQANFEAQSGLWLSRR